MNTNVAFRAAVDALREEGLAKVGCRVSAGASSFPLVKEDGSLLLTVPVGEVGALVQAVRQAGLQGAGLFGVRLSIAAGHLDKHMH